MREIFWSHLRWPEVQELEKKKTVVIVPVGSTEGQGPALPVGGDTLNVEIMAKMVAEKLKDKVRVVVTPAIWTGCAYALIDYPGTITITPELLTQIIYQVCKNILHWGFKKILLLNGHAGNEACLWTATYKLRQELDATIAWVTHWNLIKTKEEVLDILESRPPLADHPGEAWASLALTISPESVDTSRFEKLSCLAKTPKSKFVREGKVSVFAPMALRTKDGASGDNTLASEEKGKKLLNLTVAELEKFLLEFKDWNLDDLQSLYQKPQ